MLALPRRGRSPCSRRARGRTRGEGVDPRGRCPCLGHARLGTGRGCALCDCSLHLLPVGAVGGLGSLRGEGVVVQVSVGGGRAVQLVQGLGRDTQSLAGPFPLPGNPNPREAQSQRIPVHLSPPRPLRLGQVSQHTKGSSSRI